MCDCGGRFVGVTYLSTIFSQWRVGRGASENTYIINTYEDDPSVPVFRWAFAHAGNEQFIVLLPEPKEFFIDPTDTPNVYM